MPDTEERVPESCLHMAPEQDQPFDYKHQSGNNRGGYCDEQKNCHFRSPVSWAVRQPYFGVRSGVEVKLRSRQIYGLLGIPSARGCGLGGGHREQDSDGRVMQDQEDGCEEEHLSRCKGVPPLGADCPADRQ